MCVDTFPKNLSVFKPAMENTDRWLNMCDHCGDFLASNGLKPCKALGGLGFCGSTEQKHSSIDQSSEGFGKGTGSRPENILCSAVGSKPEFMDTSESVRGGSRPSRPKAGSQENAWDSKFVEIFKGSRPVENERIGNEWVDTTFTPIYGHWHGAESRASSTWRELEAIYRILKSFEKLFSSKILIWHTDCKNLLYVLKGGSPVSELNILAIKVTEFCLQVKKVVFLHLIQGDSFVHPRDEN